MKISIKDLELTDDCPKCDGSCYTYGNTLFTANPMRSECERCHGRGEVLNEQGLQFITFIKTYWDEVE